MIVNLKLVFVGAVEGILFCTAILMLGVVARHAIADGPGGGVLCVPVDPGTCDYHCCNRCILYEDELDPEFFYCGGHCKWLTESCTGCQAGCKQEVLYHRDRGDYCPCLMLQ